MTTRTWDVSLDSGSHTIKIKHNPWIGNREIYVDGQSVIKGAIFCDSGSVYQFEVGGQKCELGIVAGITAYKYYLKVNKEFVIPRGKARNAAGAIPKVTQIESDFWNELEKQGALHESRLPGLAYRYFGSMQGFFFMIGKGFEKNGLPVVFLVVRHKPRGDFAGTKKEFFSDPQTRQVMKEARAVPAFELTDSYAELAFLYNSQKLPPQKTIGLVSQFIASLSKYTSPTSHTECEGGKCKNRFNREIRLVLINGFPQFLCTDCINDLASLGKENKEAYEDAPSRIHYGIIAGIGMFLIGSVLMAFAMFLFTPLYIMGGIILLLGAVKILERLRVKITIPLLLYLIFMAFMSSLGGLYLAALWARIDETVLQYGIGYLFANSGWLAGKAEDAWEKLIEEMYIPIMINTVYGGLLLWSFSHNRKRSLALAFDPNIIVVDDYRFSK